MNNVHMNSVLLALVFMFLIRKTSATGTPISGLWSDDYHHAKLSSATNGWFKQNKVWSDNLNKYIYKPLSNILTTGTAGTIYYGPLQVIADTTDVSNYFKRKFVCTIPTNTVIIQFETAICEGLDHETNKTEIQININSNGTYRSQLDSNTTEGGYELTDDVLKTQCQDLTHSTDNLYWIQSHSTKRTVDYMNNNITQNEDFDITIRMNVHNNDVVLLYGITVECSLEIDPDDDGSSHSHSRHIPEMIDCGANCDNAGHEFGVMVGTVFGIAIGICAILIIGYKCIKHIRLKLHLKYQRQINQENSIIDDSFVPIM